MAIIEKVQPLILQKNPSRPTPSTPKSSIEEAFLFIKSERQLLKIATKDIHYVKASGDYVSIYLNQQKPIIAHGTLQKVKTKLPEKDFIRVHRSYVVALRHIDAIVGNMVKVGTESIIIGKGYKKQLEAAINVRRLL